MEYSGGNVYIDAPRGRNRVYLPGSFNPLHDGHKAMLNAAVQQAGPDSEGCYELTVMNADKVRVTILMASSPAPRPPQMLWH